MIKNLSLLLLISQILNVSEFSELPACKDIMSLEGIKHCITEHTTCYCVHFSGSFWSFRRSLTEELRDNFIDAMYSLEYREFTLKEPEAIILFQNIYKKLPFSHPQLLGNGNYLRTQNKTLLFFKIAIE